MTDKSKSLQEMSSSKQESCPICKQPATASHSPFCSKRCKSVDLNRWLSGSYAIPAEDEEPMSIDGNEGESNHFLQ
ncbi:DNA gyrase inhibitor YacG [Flexibacterium corallicola]|uniref:DNA gyrase inhibitor YacG n=1 Tax=Flexibacterium corallicola TaxID=3037259 RepID=UPI0038621020